MNTKKKKERENEKGWKSPAKDVQQGTVRGEGLPVGFW